MNNVHTATRYYLGSQNDQLYITAGEPPAQSNDYPNHEADRTLIAKVFDEATGKLIVRACNAHDDLVRYLEDITLMVSYIVMHGAGEQPEPIDNVPQAVRITPADLGRLIHQIGDTARAALAKVQQ